MLSNGECITHEPEYNFYKDFPNKYRELNSNLMVKEIVNQVQNVFISKGN